MADPLGDLDADDGARLRFEADDGEVEKKLSCSAAVEGDLFGVDAFVRSSGEPSLVLAAAPICLLGVLGRPSVAESDPRRLTGS